MIRLIKEKKMNKVFISFLFRVLPVFIVPVTVLLTVYYSSNQVINQQTYEKNLAILQNSADTIQKTFHNMDNLIIYLDRSPVIDRFLTLVNPVADGSTTMDMLNAQSDLASLTTANDIISNIQLYSRKHNILIDSSTSALYLDRYYAYERVQGMSMDDWLRTFLKAPQKNALYSDINITSAGRKSKSIIYAKSLPISESSDFKGSVFIYLDEDYLLKQYKNIDYKNTGFIYILDDQGRILLYDNSSSGVHPTVDAGRFEKQSGYFSQDIGGKDMFVTYYKEPAKGWVYVAALPMSQVLAPTANIRLYIGILILFTLLAGGILVISSVSKLSRPISHIFSLFAEKNQNLSYNDFEDEIAKMVDNNQKMQDALNNQIPELKTSIFYNLLIGGYRDTEVIRQNLSKISIKLDAKHYVVLIASINELNTSAKLEEISAQKLYINSILTQYISGIQGIYNLDFERTVLLLGFDDRDNRAVLQNIENNVRNVVENFKANVMISVSFSGDITDDIQKIPSCFFNAYTAINYKQKDPFSTVQWFVRPKHADKTNFYYPIDLESQLIEMVHTGKTTKLAEIFEKIDQQNKHIITQNQNQVFFNLLLSMNSTLIRIFNERRNYPGKIMRDGTRIASKLEAREDYPQTYYLLKEVFTSIALFNKDEHRQSNSSQQAQILQYIDEHYSDPLLSLSSVADVFKITEVYLSQLFKHISGENFSKYVENLRLKKAHELIGKGFRINEVSQMSGYNSPQVFRRAYKRKYGVTPTEDARQESETGASGIE